MAASWKQMLQQSLDANKKLPYAKYYQIATVKPGPEPRPANRTVVHRSFYGDDGLTFVTDLRSEKVGELKANPLGEAAWYFEDSREQFRLGGRLTVVGYQHPDEKLLEERRKTWSTLSPGGRGQFTYPDPRQPRKPDDEGEFKKEPPSEDSEPESNFCIVILDVDAVDYVNLRGPRRIEFTSNNGPDGKRQWSSQDVNP